MQLKIAATVVLATQASASVAGLRNVPKDLVPSKAGWGKINTLVAFGDSYTDEGRLSYFIEHNGEAPPKYWVAPESARNSTASGGQSWARYVAQYAGIELRNYAVSGAVCSNDLTPRYLSAINGPFPALNDYEIPQFTAEFTSSNKPLFDPASTLFSIWIGTNDLGGDNILTGFPTVRQVNYTHCVVSTIEQLYSLGARNFILQNNAPLQFAPLYAPVELGGSEGPHRFWRDRSGNATRISWQMRDLVESSNEIFAWRVPAVVQGRLKGARVAVFDSYSLMLDIYHNPQNYLNGSLPLNVTGFSYHCNLDSSNCFTYRADDRDSFFWYDELHPSEQVGRIIAREFVNTINGVSKYVAFW